MTLGMLLLFVVGLVATLALAPALSLLERVGLSFPLGVALVTFSLLLCDWVGLPLTAATQTGVALVWVAVLLVPAYRHRHAVAAAAARRPDFSGCHLAFIALLGFVVYMEYANLAKCLFLPTYDRDSLAAFDTIGYLISREHTFHALSIFSDDYMPGIHGAGSPIGYTPMLQLAYAYVYNLGAETSKAIPAVLYLSFLVAFYAVTVRFTTPTFSMLATLFVLYAPEMTSFSSLSGTNAMHAAYASLGLIYLFAWRNRGVRRGGDLAMGCLLLAANTWVRAEGIVFVVAGACVVLAGSWRERRWANLLPALLMFVPVVVWALFTRLEGLTAQSVLIAHPLLDGEKLRTVADGAWALVSNPAYYGWTFKAFALAVLADAYFLVRRKDSFTVLGATLLAFVLYFLALYQIDYRWDSIDNVLAYSAKRFMFCFVPLAWFFVVTCTPVRTLAAKFDAWICR